MCVHQCPSPSVFGLLSWWMQFKWSWQLSCDITAMCSIVPPCFIMTPHTQHSTHHWHKTWIISCRHVSYVWRSLIWYACLLYSFLHSVENPTWALLLVPVLVEADERMAVDWWRASWCGQGRDESPSASPVPGDNHNSAGTRDHILISRYLHMSALLNRITTASPNHPVTTVRATLLPLLP